LKAYIHKKTTAQEAAKAITRPILESEDPHGDMWRVWSLIMSALIELPSEHISYLIKLLLAIQELPEHDLKGEEEERKAILEPI
jgi:hypothetical protein